MKAIVCEDFNQSRVAEIPKPEPEAGEVSLKVKRVQLSVTDCQLYNGEQVVHYDSVRDRIERGDGQLFGHEFCGVVESVGDGVTQFSPGDRVYAAGKIPCQECEYCRRGYSQFCKNTQTIGLERPGATGEYLCLPTDPLRRLPDGVSDAEGAAMQPLASAVLCVHDAEIDTGDVVVVLGAGVMGSQCAQLAARQGASEVYAVDILQEKLDLVERFGVRGISAREDDPIALIDEITDGIGADVVFEAVGGNQDHATRGADPLAQAVQIVRSGGKVVQVGSIAGEMSIVPRDARSKHLRWINPTRGAKRISPNVDSGDLAAQLVANDQIRMEDYITHELEGLSEFERAVEITLHKDQYDALGPAQLVLE